MARSVWQRQLIDLAHNAEPSGLFVAELIGSRLSEICGNQTRAPYKHTDDHIRGMLFAPRSGGRRIEEDYGRCETQPCCQQRERSSLVIPSKHRGTRWAPKWGGT